MGSLCGMSVASLIVLPQLISDKRDAAGQILFYGLSEAEKADIRLHDLAVIRNPYVAIGIVVLLVLTIIAMTKMPKTQSEEQKSQGISHTTRQTLSNLWHNSIYREGVLAQMFYVAAQIMTWTFIIQYADYLGINKATAQMYNIVAMSLFLCSRFISTFLMKYVNSRCLLAIFGCGAALCSIGAIVIVGLPGLYCLVAISFFMSLMFPTIYGIALENVDSQDTTLGAAFLVMAIVGGALMPPLQGFVIDQQVILGHPAVNVSFFLPLLCFLTIICYGYRSYKQGLTEK
jgi:FHS family L-fucose permease-like MFS transporter